MSESGKNISDCDHERDVVGLPIDGELDLHAFHPRDVSDLVPNYLNLCREEGILTVRIVHGKGTGALRKSVHAILTKLPYVLDFSLAPVDAGHWGATLVTLAGPSREKSE